MPKFIIASPESALLKAYWKVYFQPPFLRRYTEEIKVHDHLRAIPPLIPPRGEVNAADAFDIGMFS